MRDTLPLLSNRETRGLPAPLISGTLAPSFNRRQYAWQADPGARTMATTKKDLVDRIAESTGAKRTLVKAVVQQFFDEIVAELAKGNRLEFRGFGVFQTKTTPARIAQNPQTLEKVPVPARRRAVFKTGRLTRKALNAMLEQTVPQTKKAEPVGASGCSGM